MAQASFPLDNFTLVSTWVGTYDEDGFYEYTPATTQTLEQEFNISSLPAGCIPTAASLSAVYNSPYTGAAIRKVDGTTFYSPRDVLSRIQALNGVYTAPLKFTFAFKAYGNAGGAGNHSSSLIFSDITLTITYVMPAATGELNLAEVDIGQTIRIQNIVRQDAAYTTKAVWKLKGQGVQNQDIGTAAFKDFTLPASWYPILPAAVEGDATCELQTYNGTTLLGSNTYAFKAKVPAAIKPSIASLAAAPQSASTPAVPSEWNKYVKGKSRAVISANVAAGTGSSIKSISVVGAGFTGTALPFTSGILQTVGDFDFVVTVVDQRDRSHNLPVTVTVVDYREPSASNVLFSRAATDGGAPDPSGTYIRGIATISAAMPAGVSNPITAKAYYRQVGTSTWLPVGGVTVTSGAAFWMGGGTIAVDHPYEVKLELTDTLSTVPITAVLPTAAKWWDFQADRAALGRYATNTKELAIPDDWDIRHKGQTLEERYGRIRIYRNPSDLGLTVTTSTTLTDVYNALPDYSMLIYSPPTGSTTDISPATDRYGELEMVRIIAARCFAVFYAANSGNMYRNRVYSGTPGTWDKVVFDGSTLADRLTMPRLRLTDATDADGNAANDVALIIGPPTGTHLEFDGNEIMAKSNGTTPSALYLNAQGGDVQINGYAAYHQGNLQHGSAAVPSLPANSVYIKHA